MPEITETLEERGNAYGEFLTQSEIAQGIKEAFRVGNWKDLSYPQKECLDMMANKLGRILNGDPNFHDSWYDIVGYVTLVLNTLPNQKTEN